MDGRFEIKGLIGEGGAGSVYKAYDTTLDRIVAIKRLRTTPIDGREISEVSGSHATPKALLQEAKLLSSLQHPNIVTVYDVGISEEEVFIVMEFLTGDTLGEVVSKSVLPLDDFIKVATQALEGLHAAHGKSMLHRDIKPPNLMLVWDSSGDYRVKLLDFGLAKRSNIPAPQTIDHSSSILGSIHFMAPEQFERAPLDARSDLYSLGCVLYYSLTGHYPFQGETPAVVMSSHLQGQKWPISQLRSDVPESIQAWLDTLMARWPEQRFPNAKSALLEFQKATQASLTDSTTPAQSAHATGEGPSSHTKTGGLQTQPTTAGVSPQLDQSNGGKTTLWVSIACLVAVGVGVAVFLFRPKPDAGGEVSAIQPSHAGDPAREEVKAVEADENVDAGAQENAVVANQEPSPIPGTQLIPTPGATGEEAADRKPAIFDPFDTESIHRHLGDRITVEGRVVRVGESKSGKTRYLNFSRTPGESISLNLLTRDVNVPIEQLKAMVGQVIRGTGKVDDFNGLHVRIIHLNDVEIQD